MRNKQELTNLLIELLTDNKPDYKTALHSWWYNTRDGGGMRLTSTGFVVFKKLDFEIKNAQQSNEHVENFAREKLNLVYPEEELISFEKKENNKDEK